MIFNGILNCFLLNEARVAVVPEGVPLENWVKIA
mgnify:CR=1 FL=1